MIDGSVLFNSVGQTGAVTQQPLPPPDSQDVMRFEHIFNQGTIGQDGVNYLQMDVPILQFKDTGASSSVDFKQAALSAIQNMDGSYQQMLGQFSTMPRFSDYVATNMPGLAANEMRTYPEVGNGNPQDWGKQLAASTKATQEYMNAALDYNGMLTHWSMNAQMWMSKFALVSSAVNQVSQGFKTLFRAAG
jgi:hypothetical protein